MVRFSEEVRNFLLPQTSKLAPCLTQLIGYRMLSPEGCTDNCLPLSNIYVTKEWSSVAVPTYDSTVCGVMKHADNSPFTT